MYHDAWLTGTDLERLLDVPGRNKLVLIDSDRAFPFPRAAGGVEWFERELAAYRSIRAKGAHWCYLICSY